MRWLIAASFALSVSLCVAGGVAFGQEWDQVQIDATPLNPTTAKPVTLYAWTWFPDPGEEFVSASYLKTGCQIDMNVVIQEVLSPLTVMAPCGGSVDCGLLDPGHYSVNAMISLIPWSGGDAKPFRQGSTTFDVAPVVPNLTWSGSASGNDRWTVPANWGGVVPATDAQLSFGALVGGNACSYNDFAASTRFSGIIFTSGAASYTLQGNSIKLAGAVRNLSTTNQTISLGMEFATGGSVLETGAKGITVAGPISGVGPLIKSGSGTLTLSDANTYTGGTIVSLGTLEIAAANALPSGQSLTIANGGSVVLHSGLNACGISASPVPEPTTFALLGIAVVGLLANGLRRKR